MSISCPPQDDDSDDGLDFMMAVVAGRSTPNWESNALKAARGIPERLLQWAAYRGDLKGVQQGILCCTPSANRALALRWACQRGHLNVVDCLLPVSYLPQNGPAALADATEKEQVEVIKVLLAASLRGRAWSWAPPGEKDPLVIAVSMGNVEALSLLVTHEELASPERCAQALKVVFRTGNAPQLSKTQAAVLRLADQLSPQLLGRTWGELCHGRMPSRFFRFMDLLASRVDGPSLSLLVQMYRERGFEDLDAKLGWSMIPHTLTRLAALELDESLPSSPGAPMALPRVRL